MRAHRFTYFDVAGTLLEKAGLVDTLVEVFGRFGTVLDRRAVRERHRVLTEVLPFPDKTDRAFYDGFNAQLCFALGVIPTAPLLAAVHDACRNLPWAPFADAAALASIRTPMGILSNWDTSLEGHLLALTGGVAFTAVVGSQSVGVAKPNPAIFAHALAAIDIPPGEVLFVGDSLRLDIAPALALGIDAVLIDRDGFFGDYRGRKIASLHELSA